MFSMETSLLGLALALDAAIVSFAIGILNLEATHTVKISRGMIVCLLFGFFQFLDNDWQYVQLQSSRFLYHLFP